MSNQITAKERFRQWTDKKRAAGLCIVCGKNPPAKNKDTCRSCIIKARRRRRRLYKERLDKGLCPHCGGKREEKGVIGCRICNEKNAQRRVTDRKKKTTYQKRLYHKRLKSGVCPMCGRGVDDTKFKLCSSCRQLNREYYYMHRAQRVKASRLHYKLTHKPKPVCQVCGLHRLQCSLCGKMMKVKHGPDYCVFTCACGSVEKRVKEKDLAYA